MSGSAQYAVVGNTFTFTCTATHAVDLWDTIVFHKAKPQYWYGCMSQYLDGCREDGDPNVYDHVHCGTGTDNSSSSVKVYSLHIFQVRDEHITDWWCYMAITRLAYSNNYTVNIHCE